MFNITSAIFEQERYLAAVKSGDPSLCSSLYSLVEKIVGLAQSAIHALSACFSKTVSSTKVKIVVQLNLQAFHQITRTLLQKMEVLKGDFEAEAAYDWIVYYTDLYKNEDDYVSISSNQYAKIIDSIRKIERLYRQQKPTPPIKFERKRLKGIPEEDE